MEKIVILNNIRSSENVGSIFRTSDACGVSKIYLCGYTPAPLDRFGRENKKLTKSSLGAENLIEWEKIETLIETIRKLRGEKNFKIVGIEQSQEAVDYREIKKLYTKDNIVFVFGNEVSGLSKEDLILCDLIAYIPMFGKKESLNVSVSVGIVLYSLIGN